MKILIKSASVTVAILSLAACSDDPEVPEAETVTETRMDEVDVLDGTISDDMVDLDEEKTGDESAEDEGSEDGDQEESEDSDE
ncbi:hypothetical protein GCM10009096_08220 [Parasphingorhabdus litoris]|uniref:DNA primase n=1 Tax=Parasphingorhabdus litoris TaxID=394733 RepID=A0ABN1A7R8_9SPHN|nr:hypothetical protein [Parasphingorhabdus litoris]